MPVPDDAENVLAAMRLGWCVAEVRGRNWPGAPPVTERDLPFGRGGHPLPLHFERSPGESRMAAQAVLIGLAPKLGIDAGPADGSSYAEEVARQADRLAELPADSADVAKEWDSLARLIYILDAHIQDSLSVESDRQAGAYQLGRALAECYWALDPNRASSTQSWNSWSFLLGKKRCDEIVRLLGRLSVYMPSNTAPAIAGSIRFWQQVADSPDWRREAVPDLYRQVGIWYEVAALGQDPSTYVKAYARLRRSRTVPLAIRYFSGQLLLIAMGVAALVVLVVLLGSEASTAVINTVLAIVAAVGVSAAGLSAGRFRQDVNIDMLAIAITKVPPGAPGRRISRNQIYQAVRQR